MSFEQNKNTNYTIAFGFIFFVFFFLCILLVCNLSATSYLILKNQASSRAMGKWYGERSTEFVSPALWIPADELPQAYQVTDMERITIDVPADEIHIERAEGKTFLRFFDGKGGRYYWPVDMNIAMITEATSSSQPITLRFDITKYTYFKGGWFLVIETVDIK